MSAARRFLGLVLAAAGIGLAVVGVRSYQWLPDDAPLAVIQWGGLLIGFAVLAYGLALASAPSWREAALRFTASTPAVLIMLGVMELATRTIFPLPAFDPRLPYIRDESLIYHSDLRGVSSETHYTTNAWGLRGDAPPDDWQGYATILTMGGSATHCRFLDDADTWSARLQGLLRDRSEQVWVGDAGVDGQASFGHIVVMNGVIPDVNPDTVLLLAGANDMSLALVDQSRVIEDAWRDRGSAFLYSSQLLRLLTSTARVVSQQEVSLQAGHQTLTYVPVTSADLTPLPADLTEVLPNLPEYRRNLERIADRGEALGVQVIFLTQPTLFDDTPEWEAIDGIPAWVPAPGMRISAATFSRFLDVYNQTMLDVCIERGLLCFDLASAIPHDEAYFYDSVHFTEAGAALVAQEIDRALGDQLVRNP